MNFCFLAESSNMASGLVPDYWYYMAWNSHLFLTEVRIHLLLSMLLKKNQNRKLGLSNIWISLITLASCMEQQLLL